MLFLAESKGQVLSLFLPQAIKHISHANSISCALELKTLRRALEHSLLYSGMLLTLLNNYFSILLSSQPNSQNSEVFPGDFAMEFRHCLASVILFTFKLINHKSVYVTCTLCNMHIMHIKLQ